jgi:hypothetical protein
LRLLCGSCACVLLAASTGCNLTMRREFQSAAFELYQTGVAALFDELTEDVEQGLQEIGSSGSSAPVAATPAGAS